MVLKDNLDLLERSILTNGWTLPIVVRPDYTIIDGFHRWMVSGREPLHSKLNGLVPVAIVQHQDPAANIYGTITHNRARGVHQLGPMRNIIKSLLEQGKSVREIGQQLGMRTEEIFRLSDFSREEFIALMAGGANQYTNAKMFVNL